MPLGPLLAGAAQRPPERRGTEQGDDRGREGPGVAEGDEEPSPPGFDQIHMPPHAGRHDGEPSGHGLEDRQRQPLQPRTRRIHVERGEEPHRIGLEPREPDRVGQPSLLDLVAEPGAFRPVADEHQDGGGIGGGEGPHRLHQEAEPLHPLEPGGAAQDMGPRIERQGPAGGGAGGETGPDLVDIHAVRNDVGFPLGGEADGASLQGLGGGDMDQGRRQPSEPTFRVETEGLDDGTFPEMESVEGVNDWDARPPSSQPPPEPRLGPVGVDQVDSQTSSKPDQGEQAGGAVQGHPDHRDAGGAEPVLVWAPSRGRDRHPELVWVEPPDHLEHMLRAAAEFAGAEELEESDLAMERGHGHGDKTDPRARLMPRRIESGSAKPASGFARYTAAQGDTSPDRNAELFTLSSALNRSRSRPDACPGRSRRSTSTSGTVARVVTRAMRTHRA